jgi:hypothetical protein
MQGYVNERADAARAIIGGNCVKSVAVSFGTSTQASFLVFAPSNCDGAVPDVLSLKVFKTVYEFHHENTMTVTAPAFLSKPC